MNKKFLSAMLFGAFAIAATSTFVSCKDYDDDINNLQAQITQNTNNIKSVQDLLNKGVVITDVQPDGRDVILTLTKADGTTSTQRIQGGVDGAKGEKGDTGAQGPQGEQGPAGKDAAVRSVLPATGNWAYTQDGVTTVTDSPARGPQGEKGEQGEQGIPGEKGETGATGAPGEDGTSGAPGEKGAKGDKGDNGVDGGYYYPGEDGFWYYQGFNADGSKKNPVKATNSAGESIKWVGQGVTVSQTEDGILFANLPGEEEGTTIFISTKLQLKSLVFEPDFYYHGIAAFEATTFNINEKKVVNSTDKLKNVNEEYINVATPEAYTAVATAYALTPDLAATFILNPSNATVVTESEEVPNRWKFIGYNKQYTRSTDGDISNNFKVYKAAVAGGKVNITAQYNGAAIKEIAADEQVTVVALQYVDGDSTITSDFAAIKASKYSDLTLHLTQETPHAATAWDIPFHLYETAKDARDATDPAIKLAWNNDKGIDLREYVQTCRSYTSISGVSGSYIDRPWDTNAAAGTVEKYGFKYSFQLVGYYLGDNETSQSAHAAIADDGYTLRAQITSGGKQQAYAYDATKANNQQNVAIVGRKPIVRVLLTDTINNKIAAAGYMRIDIVKPEATTDPDPAPYTISFASTDAYTMVCPSANKLFERYITWDEVEEKIMAKLNLSKTDFEDKYELDGFTSGSHPAKQFDDVTNDANQVTTDLGVVERTTTDVMGTMTEVLLWTLTEKEAWETFVVNGKNTASVNVRYALKSGETGPRKYFYVTFTWTPTPLNRNPQTNFGDGNKLASYWYANNSNVEKSGFDEIHFSVETTGTDVAFQNTGSLDKATSAADDEFVNDIRTTLYGYALTVDDFTAPYASLNANRTTKFEFVNGNGLTASADGSQLFDAAGNLIVTLDTETGVVKYADNDAAKALLNDSPGEEGHKNIAGSVTATVNIKAYLCSGADAREVPVTNNGFNIKFLRPITLQNGECEFFDAATGGDDEAIEFTFIDWRDHNFDDPAKTKGYDYFQYYGIKKIFYDIANATTDLRGPSHNDLLSVAAPLFKLTPKAPLTYAPDNIGGVLNTTPNKNTSVLAGRYGILHYDNNGSVMSGATVTIPVEVTYDWGVIKTSIKCKFNRTEANVELP